MSRNQKGFGVVETLVIIIILGILGFAGWAVLAKNSTPTSGTTQDNRKDTAVASQKLLWQQTASGWEAMGDTPACPAQPMLKAPADLSKASSVLYPGQMRGQYKPHGGIRFDSVTDNSVTVTAPIDGYIVKAARNFAQGTTEVQYDFDIMNNCGIMMRFGHLREVPGSLQTVFDKLPEPSADSRVENVNPPVYVKQGEVLATKVGLISEKNTFFDWGVYDYRQQNDISKSASYQSAHTSKELDWYAVCWLQGWLPQSDAALLASLPAGGGESGKSSDYCKQ